MHRLEVMPRWLIACSVGLAIWGLAGGSSRAALDGNCTESAKNAKTSCDSQAEADYWLARSKCSNLADPAERRQCRQQARRDREDALAECEGQLEARLSLCDELGEDPYDPVIDPAKFVSTIDNPYLPMIPGTTFVYKTTDGHEVDTVAVTQNVKVIVGVTCVEVRDTLLRDGQLTEDTLDWFAQDVLGNVWYFGEHSESFEDGELVSLEGSWQAGEEGASPGIIMQAQPQIGQTYRQEFLVGTAEDAATVVSLTAHVSVPYGSFDNCLRTREFSSLEPDTIERKYYAPGVGLVLETDPETGERNELVSVSH
jgi:hypothetical protein